MSVAILVPMLGRPHRVEPLLDSIEANTPEEHRVLFLLTPGDSAVAAVKAAGGGYLTVRREKYGDYARKINLGVAETDTEFVFTAADDLAFHRNWFPNAARRITNKVGVVGTNDLANRRVMRGEHSTHSIVARWYCQLGTIDEPGKLLHEGYPHEFCDDELVGTARFRGAFDFARDSIVEHLHPMAGHPSDALYEQQGYRMRLGRPLYERRRPMWT